MSSTAPQKKYFSTTNHHGGALHSSYYQLRRAHFGHPYTCTAPLPITTGRSKYHSLRTPSSLHTFLLPITTGAPQIPFFGHPLILLLLTYLPTNKHHGGVTNTHSFHTPHPLPISTDPHSFFLWIPLILTHYQFPRTTPAMVAIPLTACLGACLGFRRSWQNPDKIPPILVESPRATMAGA